MQSRKCNNQRHDELRPHDKALRVDKPRPPSAKCCLYAKSCRQASRESARLQPRSYQKRDVQPGTTFILRPGMISAMAPNITIKKLDSHNYVLMKKQKPGDVMDCPRDFQESAVPYEKPSKEKTEFTQSDLQSAAENVMVFLGAKALVDLRELTKESAIYLEAELEEFIGTLENVHVPKNLLEASKKFCVKYYKE